MGRPIPFAYDNTNRRGDHICYISDTRKLQEHYPGWHISRPLDTILDDIVTFEQSRIGPARSEESIVSR